MLKGGSFVVLTGDHSLPSYSPSHEVTNNEYRFYFNLMIKTIGLHRYLVKYIYSTLSHGLAFHLEILPFSHPTVSYSSLQGSVCSSANFTSVQDRTEQQCSTPSSQFKT